MNPITRSYAVDFVSRLGPRHFELCRRCVDHFVITVNREVVDVAFDNNSAYYRAHSLQFVTDVEVMEIGFDQHRSRLPTLVRYFRKLDVT